MSGSDRARLDLAVKVAETSEMRQKHGAVVVKGGRVLAVGVNKARNDPAWIEADAPVATIFSICAERDALSRVKDARGATIYVARVTGRGESYSRPCSRCAKVMVEAGVKAVVYTIGES